MAEAAGVLILRGGDVLLSPRPLADGLHLGWIGGRLEPGEAAADAARREAREEVGCEVELLPAARTFEESDGLLLAVEAPLPAPAPLLRTRRAELYLARALGEPRAVDVPAIVWVPVERLPGLGRPTWLPELGAVARVADGTVTGLVRRLVAEHGPAVLVPDP